MILVVANGGDRTLLVWKRLIDRAKRLVAGRRALPTGADSLAELCVKSQESYIETAVCRYVPIRGMDVAEPSVDSRPILLSTVIGDDLWEVYRNPSRAFPQGAASSMGLKCLNRRFNRILGPIAEYHRYWNRADVRPLWHLDVAESCVASCTST